MLDIHSDRPKDVEAYGEQMYQLGRRNAYQEIGVMLAQGLAEIPMSTQKAEVPAERQVKSITPVDWAIESLHLSDQLVRILKRHEIYTLKDLTKLSAGDLQQLRGLGAARVAEINNAVRRNGMTLRER